MFWRSQNRMQKKSIALPHPLFALVEAPVYVLTLIRCLARYRLSFDRRRRVSMKDRLSGLYAQKPDRISASCSHRRDVQRSTKQTLRRSAVASAAECLTSCWKMQIVLKKNEQKKRM